jgi:hypothetical protein
LVLSLRARLPTLNGGFFISHLLDEPLSPALFSQQIKKFLHRQAGLLNDGTKEPALDVAGVVGHRYETRPVWMLKVVVGATGVVVGKSGAFKRLHHLPC